MALQNYSVAVGAFDDADAGGKNYFAGVAVYIYSKEDDTLADIFTDDTGVTPIVQDGVQNVTNSNGVFEFAIDEGQYYYSVDGETQDFAIAVTDHSALTNRNAVGAHDAIYNRVFYTLSDAINQSGLVDGISVDIKEREVGDGDCGVWDIVLTSSVTPNGFNIVQSVADPSLSFVYRPAEKVRAFNDVGQAKLTLSISPSEIIYVESTGLHYRIFSASTIAREFDFVLANNNVAAKIESDINQSKKLQNLLDYKLTPFSNTDSAINTFGGKKGAVLLGDSISHGTGAGDIFVNGWAFLLGRAINANTGSRSFGWMPWEDITVPAVSNNLHTVTRTGTWSYLDGASATDFIGGSGLRSTAAGNKINISVPSFQAIGRIVYHTVPGGGQFTVKVNGVLVQTVDTDGVFDNFSSYGAELTDNGYGICEIEIETLDSGQVDFSGVGYFSPSNDSCLNVCAKQGRRLAHLSESVIKTICENSDTLILALGHNDTTSNTADVTQVIDWVIQYVNENGINLVVPDFRWASTNKFVNQELRRAARSVNNGIYIDFPARIADNDGTTVDSNYLVNTLKMFVDISHPNPEGNAWVFEVVAKAMGLSIASKDQALNYHDYTIPLRLKDSTGVYNSQTLIGAGLSTVRRNGKNLDVNIAFQPAASGGFPVGSYVVADAWPARCGFSNIQEGVYPAQLRYDNGALTGSLRVEVGGKMTFYSSTGAWLTTQKFNFQCSGEAL